MALPVDNGWVKVARPEVRDISLSTRQRRAAELKVCGLTNVEIAAELHYHPDYLRELFVRPGMPEYLARVRRAFDPVTA